MIAVEVVIIWRPTSSFSLGDYTPPLYLIKIVGEPSRQFGVNRTATSKQDAGYLHDDPLHEPWLAAMEEYRRQLDEDPEAL